METRLGSVADIAITPAHLLDRERPPANERQLGKLAALTQFGVNHLTLASGARSARRHWHEGEDEFAFILSGTATLVDDNGEHELHAGAFVGFPAGVANAHHLLNRSSAPVEILVVGTRKTGEERIHYPDEADPGPFTVRRDARGNRVA